MHRVQLAAMRRQEEGSLMTETAAVKVYELTELPRNPREFDKILNRLNFLLGQLSPTAKPMKPAYFRRLVEQSPQSHLYVAEIDGVIVGMTTRVDKVLPTRVKCDIDDVVVDEEYRGDKVATRILTYALDMAPPEAEYVDLTTSKGVDLLYKILGFVHRTTNNYRLKLEDWRRRQAA